MRIAVVAHEMEGRRTGVGRYLEGLLEGLVSLSSGAGSSGIELELFFKGDPFSHPLWNSGAPVKTHFDGRPSAHTVLWEQRRLPRLLRKSTCDLFFSPAYSLPPLPRGMRSMVTVHDLSFELLGHEFSWRERWRRRFLARLAVRRASRVLADTTTIAQQLERLYRVPAQRLAVVPLGIDEKFLEVGQEAEDVKAVTECGVEEPYILFLGSILARRHLDLVIAAFAAVEKEHPRLRLVIAGANRLRMPGDLEDWIGASGVADRIIRLGYVAEEMLPALYRRAELSYYLSSYEGYGLPPLESLAAGTPAVVGRGLALDDLWLDYPYRCSSLEKNQVVEQTKRALADSAERTLIGAEGRQRMAKLSWQHAAELFLGEAQRAVAYEGEK